MMMLSAISGPSEVARQVDSAMLFFLVFCLVLLVGITGTMLYFVVKYRRSKVRKPKQIHGHLGLEIAWTVIPTILVVGLFFVGYEGFVVMREVPAGAMEVKVTGQQWFWSFHYPEADVTSAELYVPQNRPIRLSLGSPDDDVLHSFYVPAFRIKEDVVPGSDTYLWLESEEVGTYNVFCAEFCGKDHSRMITKMHVLTQGDFDAWLEGKIAERFRPVDGHAAMDPDNEELAGYDGKQLYGKYCAACHMPDGRGGGQYEARDLTSFDGWTRTPKKTDILLTISKGLDDTQMRPFGHLPVRERLAIMHHVASLAASSDRPEVTEDDIVGLQEALPETDPEKAQVQVVLEPTVPIDEAMKQVVEEGAQR